METEETAAARLSRRAYHFAAHPLAWLHWIWVRELRSREIYFRDHPRFRFWSTMYRVVRRPLSTFLGRSLEELDGYFAELDGLHRELLGGVSDLPIAGALSQAPLLYVLVRAEKPAWAIETGISAGYSTRLLLEGMRRNGSGHLDSIGVDVFALRTRPDTPAGPLTGRQVGWLVPESLRPYWTLHLGRSEEILPALLSGGSDRLGLFLHDSLHQYATMRWEYSTAYPVLAPGGLLASHDIHASPAWTEFLRGHGITSAVELDRDLGVARKPPG